MADPIKNDLGQTSEQPCSEWFGAFGSEICGSGEYASWFRRAKGIQGAMRGVGAQLDVSPGLKTRAGRWLADFNRFPTPGSDVRTSFFPTGPTHALADLAQAGADLLAEIRETGGTVEEPRTPIVQNRPGAFGGKLQSFGWGATLGAAVAFGAAGYIGYQLWSMRE